MIAGLTGNPRDDPDSGRSQPVANGKSSRSYQLVEGG